MGGGGGGEAHNKLEELHSFYVDANIGPGGLGESGPGGGESNGVGDRPKMQSRVEAAVWRRVPEGRNWGNGHFNTHRALTMGQPLFQVLLMDQLISFSKDSL